MVSTIKLMAPATPRRLGRQRTTLPPTWHWLVHPKGPAAARLIRSSTPKGRHHFASLHSNQTHMSCQRPKMSIPLLNQLCC